MKKELGLWIDHREAIISVFNADASETKQLESDMEKHVRLSSGSAGEKDEDIRDHRIANHLKKYYDEVITHIRDADSILIMGPGEAKGELKKQLESERLGERIVAVETTDKLTDRQVAEKVREYFSK